MHLTDHIRLESIMTYKPERARPSLLLNSSEGIFPHFAADYFRRTKPVEEAVPLQPDETIRIGDIVEDLSTGERVPVEFGTFYDFLHGVKVRQAKEMPSVFDVLRRR